MLRPMQSMAEGNKYASKHVFFINKLSVYIHFTTKNIRMPLNSRSQKNDKNSYFPQSYRVTSAAQITFKTYSLIMWLHIYMSICVDTTQHMHKKRKTYRNITTKRGTVVFLSLLMSCGGMSEWSIQASLPFSVVLSHRAWKSHSHLIHFFFRVGIHILM